MSWLLVLSASPTPETKAKTQNVLIMSAIISATSQLGLEYMKLRYEYKMYCLKQCSVKRVGMYVYQELTCTGTEIDFSSDVQHARPTLIVLSNPPLNIWSPASLNATAVTCH